MKTAVCIIFHMKKVTASQNLSLFNACIHENFVVSHTDIEHVVFCLPGKALECLRSLFCVNKVTWSTKTLGSAHIYYVIRPKFGKISHELCIPS